MSLRQKRKKYVADYKADGIDPSIKEAADHNAAIHNAASEAGKERASV